MPETGHYRLDDLKERWKRDPSSRLFLQLADEHRKLGQHAEAVAVLEQGLEHRPNDLSALVALGRCRLELEQAAEAIGPLEEVVTRDPTHIVANKLLVEAHLQQGDAARAGERLETYRLLNDRDPELDHLEYRLEHLRAEQPAASPAEPLEESADFDSAEVEPGGEEEREETAAPAEDVAGTTPSDPFQLAGGPPPAPDLGDLWARPAPPEPGPEDPFRGLTGLDAALHWELLSQEGIFAAPPAPAKGDGTAPAEDEVEAAPSAARSTRPVRKVEPEAPAPEAAAPEAAAPEAAEPMTAELAADEVSPVADDEGAAAAGVETAEEPEPPTAEELPSGVAAVGAAAGVAAAAGIAAAALSREPEQPAAAAASPPAPPALETAESEEEAATATLGELYLKQGHRREAERIFRRVLERDPGNRRALAGLDRLAELGAKPLTAADLLAVRRSQDRIPEGLTAKKILVLGNYIQHLRAGARRHVH